MEEEKQMEEMVESMKKARKECGESSCAGCDCAKYGAFCQFAKCAKVAIRKADEVRKEMAKEIYERVDKWLDEIVPHTREETILICLLGWIKTKFGIEVGE